MLARRNSWPALELLKALAIASMVFVHTWGISLTPEDLVNYRNSWVLKIANVLHFFCFFNIWIPALAGSSLRLQCGEDLNPNSARKLLRVSAWTWGLVLILSGTLFFFMLNQNNPFLFFNPLHFIGISFLVISALLYVGSTSLMWLWSALFFIVSIGAYPIRQKLILNPPSLIYVGDQSAWSNALENYLSEIVFGSRTIGWSFLPWIVSVFLGFAIVDKFLKSRNSEKQLKLISLISMITVVLGLTCPESINFIRTQTINDQYSTLSMPLSLFVSTLTGYLLLLTLGTIYFDKKKLKAVSQTVTCLSRGSFWIFFLEFPLLYVFNSFFESQSFFFRILVFPIFMLGWSFLVGLMVIEIGKKKFKISLVKEKKITIEESQSNSRR
jgi:hypothetical protein